MKHQPLLRLGRLAVLGVLCLASCQVAKEVNVVDNVSYDLTVEASLPATRTANDGLSTKWVGNDMLSVLHAEAGKTQFYGSAFTYSGEENTFKGRVLDVSTVNDWYLLYPYREDNVDAKQMHINVANVTVQTGNDNMAHIAGEGIPLWGRALNVERSTSLNVTMQNVLAIQRFAVSNTTMSPIVVKEVSMAVPSTVTGSYVGDLTANEVEWVPEGASSQNVTVTVEDGAQIPAGEVGHFYAATVPFTFKAGEKMNIHVVAVHPSNPNQEIHYYFVRTNSSDVTFTPGHITPIPAAFDENHQTQDPDAPTVKKNQTLSFASESITWTLGDVYAKNGIYNLPMTVVGAQTSPVTYSSDTPSVAEITSEGKVLIKDTGYTFIKAIAPENDEYNSAEASFKLIIAEEAVTPSTTRTYTYVAPNNITVEANSNSAGTFLITGVESSPAELSVAKFPQKETGNWSSSQGQVTNGEFIPHKVLDGVSTTANSITTDDAEVIASEVELISSGNGWKFKAKGNGQYLAAPSQNYRISFTNESSAGVFTISGGSSSQWGGTSSNGATVMTGSYYFYHSGSADGFTLRTNSTTNTRFYKLENSKQNQTLSFGDVTWTLGDGYESGGTYTFPQAQGAQTLVRYTSDNSSVAEIVDATSNRVKINGTGTAHITATADETTSYYGATATMTITIKPASTTPVTGSAYVKVTGEPTSWDGTYLFVDETSSKAFAAFSGVSGYAVNVTISNGRIAANSTVNQYALTVTDAGVAHANASGQRAYDVKNSDGKYIFYSSSTLQIADSHSRNSTDYYHAFKYFAASGSTPAGVQVLSSGHSSGYNKYYLGYSSSAFGYAQSSDTRRVQLYKLEGEGGGTDPVDPGTDPEPGTNTTYTKVTSLTAGGTYVITDIKDAKLFKGASDGSYVSVSPANGVITDATNSFAGYEFTVEQSGSNYYLKFSDGKYLVCDYGTTSGNSTTGLRYVNSQSNVQYPYSLTIRNGAFEFYTTQISNTSNTNETLYFKDSSDLFKIGQSGVNVGVHLYLKTTSGGGTTPSKQDQNPYFASSAVTETRATASGTLAVQAVQGAYGTVTYSSSNSSVATVSGTTLTIRGFGQTTITADAAGNDSYNPGSAAYTLTVVQSGSSTGNVYVKANSLTVGGTYLVVDVSDTRLFRGTTDGAYDTISPVSGVITDATGSYASYEFTITQSGSKYCLMHDGKYVIDDYSSRGNSTTGLTYESEKPEDKYLYGCTVTNGVFFLSTDQRNPSSTSTNTTGEVLYYKPQSAGGTGANTFKIGGSGRETGVHLYLKESSGSGKQVQTLYFDDAKVTRTMDTASGTMSVQTVHGNKTTVNYGSTNSSVATVSGTTITIKGFGTTEITADAIASDDYYAGSTSYTLEIKQTQQVGVFNLENEAIHDYLDDVEAFYTTDNRTRSRVTTYAKNVSADNRLDWPSPVTVEWTNTSTSGNKTVYVYNDAAHTDQVDYVKPVSVSGSSNTAEIYNLIPGHTYYYVVRSGSTQVASGDFSTTGRRRMMKIGSDYGQNYANNCRDLGGQVTISGKTIKYGRIYRGSNMDGSSNSSWWGGSGPLSDDAKETILAYMKISLDVDLRGDGDRKNALNGTTLNGVTYSFTDIKAYHPTDNDPTKIVDNLDLYQGHTNESYSGTGDLNSRTKMKATLTRIMTAVVNGLNVYIHCAVGADRTGYTCMMLEAILGVPLERCDMDYEMTSFSVVGTRSRSGDSVNYYHSGVSLLDGRLSNTNTYQEKAVDYATNSSNGLGIPMDLITRFQNAMLE